MTKHIPNGMFTQYIGLISHIHLAHRMWSESRGPLQIRKPDRWLDKPPITFNTTGCNRHPKPTPSTYNVYNTTENIINLQVAHTQINSQIQNTLRCVLCSKVNTTAGGQQQCVRTHDSRKYAQINMNIKNVYNMGSRMSTIDTQSAQWSCLEGTDNVYQITLFFFFLELFIDYYLLNLHIWCSRVAGPGPYLRYFFYTTAP